MNTVKLGVLGGGQLGKMLVQSAMNFDMEVRMMDPDAEAPCKPFAHHFRQGNLKDYDAVVDFGMDCDLITIEIENVNTQALKELENRGKKVYPQPHIIELIQNKVEQKKFYQSKGIPTAPFVEVANRHEVMQKVQLPMVNKLARDGYDGRGVQLLRTAADLEKAFDAPGLIEEMVDFEKEIAIIVARNSRGEVTTFPITEMVFHPEANLVEYLFAPAHISPEHTAEAEGIARKIIEELGMVGLLAVEMFLTKDGRILVNEMAPRTHNSGHHTIEGNVTSQFEQHLRAICNMPLGSTATRSQAAMVNLLGEDGYSGPTRLAGLEEIMAQEGVFVHLYGKKMTKPFRKMGHVTVIDDNFASLRQKVELVKTTLKVIA
jgi:5-(carboxyamino)imidazole ribonucleotide synthase